MEVVNLISRRNMLKNMKKVTPYGYTLKINYFPYGHPYKVTDGEIHLCVTLQSSRSQFYTRIGIGITEVMTPKHTY